ncbi:amino acid adenylation domain-containing protein [Thozetella sp. PMI_491]|nr:amino acid adenylation domain-containing protein [Thozetella sp. PMI_491]
MATHSRTPPEPIAVIGTGCRLPGYSDTPSKLWELIRDPRDLLAPVPKSRFSADGFYHEDGQYAGHSNAREAYLLAGDDTPRRFDARFFGIRPAEAEALDPQIRLLLETVYEALEAAGLPMESLQGSDTAVYAGAMASEYERLMLRDEDTISMYHATGTSRALVSNRVSYFFDWHGPSMTIDTACSSSLIAVHQAVQQLRTGQSRVAVAAGTNLILDPQYFISFSKLRMLSPEGRSRMWDADVNGFARGEGVAAVILKTLSAAVADGDTIECVIREVGSNQDGRTPGLTMPSPSAQASLIRACYERAGLDLANPADRPQFFEAHGTGTAVGDPIEAEAIASAFFPGKTDVAEGPEKLYVGSIKSVIGHTEGTAGLAALLKASLAVQNATIPPNMHFRRLNPKIEPFYANLRVPTEALPWPQTAAVRRASVNCFGFGGANAHAIVEHYAPPSDATTADVDSTVFAPFVFSATSRISLASYIDTFCDFLQGANGDAPNLKDLAYTLHSRRSRLPISTTIAASSVPDLCSKIQERLKLSREGDDGGIGVRSLLQASEDRTPRILGVFTGQGAQWARMGSELIETSVAARQVLERLDLRLSRLPNADRPDWSLLIELRKNAASSRIHEAVFSQPLCTAVQIMLIDMLYAAGVSFSAVVGHSSGEIAAAYAAGFISAEDAICIAYYRGLLSGLAKGRQGQEGAMMAVESTVSDMEEVCGSRKFRGRVGIAAVNSPVSVTLSGDKDAVERLQVILEDEEKSARLLKVDKAYHSHHMLTCAESYLQALSSLNVKPLAGGKCAWFSSVHEREMGLDMTDELRGKYWCDNLTSPVLFMQAIQAAWAAKSYFHMAVEVGPHPALKSPALRTIQDLTDQPIPYTGLLNRKKGAIEAVADGLGMIWTLCGKGHVDLGAYDRFLSGPEAPLCKLVKGLPSYAWDHSNEYWHESRYAKAQRHRPGPVHPLLGHATPDSTARVMRWRHILRTKDVPWINDHRLQGQAVFPAAGYIVMALEAALRLCKDSPVSFLEVLDLELGRALVFNDDDMTAETIFSLTDIVRTAEVVEASFTYEAAAVKDTRALSLLASGRVRVSLGKQCTTALPPRSPHPLGQLKTGVRADEFYDYLGTMGYQYSGSFRALTGLERKLGYASGSVSDIEGTDLLFHPAVLDAAFQSTLLARSVPLDGAIWTLHVPRSIRSIRVNPSLCASGKDRGTVFSVDAVRPGALTDLTSDVDVYTNSSEHAMIQVEGLLSVPLSTCSAKDDKEVFATTVWDVAGPDSKSIAGDSVISKKERELAQLLERMSIFYLRHLDRTVPSDYPARSSGPLTGLFQFAAHCVALMEAGALPFWKPEWTHDDHQRVARACDAHADCIDVRLLRAIGESMVPIALGDKHAIEVGMKDNLLGQYYQRSLGAENCNMVLASAVKQIVHRYPHLNILEVGAGTGGATKGVFREIGQKYASYTFTDVSSAFFEAANSTFEVQHGVTFKVLDINKEPAAQGFKDQTYDLVIASMVLHATEVLDTTLRNVRRLLKPGGFLVMIEGLPNANIHLGTIFGAFPGWWAGAQDGRILSPLVDVAGWDTLFRNAGFSGCDTVSPIPDPLVAPMAVFITQAVDDRIAILRNPLEHVQQQFGAGEMVEDLCILGSRSSRITLLSTRVKILLRPYCARVTTVQSIADMDPSLITESTTVISLSELDEPLLKNPTDSSWAALKGVLTRAKTLLWVTNDRRSGNPHANMMVGLLRPAASEVPTLDLQFLDFADGGKPDARIIAETLLRLRASSRWQRDGTHKGLLTSVEPELVLDAEYRATIPRVLCSQDMNERYNSERRPVTAMAKIGAQAIHIASSETGYIVLQRQDVARAESVEILDVSHSLLSAVKVAQSGNLFLVLAQSPASDNQVVVLSTESSSAVSPWDGFSVSTEIELGEEADFLTHIANHIAASVLLKDLSRGDRLIVLEPSPAFASAVTWRAMNAGVCVTLATYNETSTDPTWVRIHPAAAERDIRRLLPENASVFVDFSAPGEATKMRGDRLRLLLPSKCRVEDAAGLFARESQVPVTAHADEARSRLQDAVNYAHHALCETGAESLGVVGVGVAAVSSAIHDELPPQTIIDWTAAPEVPVQIQSIESMPMFSDSKTYWLAGLTHSLGLSLCEWMVSKGAKYIVLSSRQPSVDKIWLRGMAAAGAVIKTLRCDVTNQDEVARTFSDICSTMPPIVGVTQGAMVLEDVGLGQMTLDQLQKVTRPKVEGSMHLNALFQENTLDFFVFFASASAIIGYSGQANYSAANLFMAGMAEHRRQRGLAASVINIGPVLGVGYMAQNKVDFRRRVEAGEGTFLSERDFHKLFAEAVVAGRPGAPAPVEITTGLTTIGLHDEMKPVWAANPILSHYIRSDDAAGPAAEDAAIKVVPIKDQLAQALTRDEVFAIVKEAFIKKLGALYQLSVESLAQEDPSNLHLNEMGTDSLLATEIRGWFVKTLQVNIPVLKILGETTVRELLNVAVTTLPASWIPKVQADDGSRSISQPSPPPVPEQSPEPLRVPSSESSQGDPEESNSSFNDEQDSDTLENANGNTETPPSFVSSGASEAAASDCQPQISISALQKKARLSLSQSMFWFVFNFLQDTSSLNHTASFRLTGKIRHADFEHALQSVGQQHEILRTCFFEHDGQPLQGVLESSTIRGEYRRIQDEKEVDQVVKELEAHRFDIAHGETLKVVLLSLSPVTHFLIVSSHSLVVDGPSFQVLWSDLEQHYTRTYRPRVIPQYADFAMKQHSYYETGKYDDELRFWRAEFTDFPETLPILSLGQVETRPALISYENERADARLSAQTKAQVRALCRRAGVTPFHFYLSVFRALLVRYTDVEDLSIGVGEAMRTEVDMGSIGPFVNLLPLRFRTSRAVAFDALLRETRSKVLAALANAKVPFPVLLDELAAPRSAACTPIFQAFIDYRMGQRETTAWADCELQLMSLQVSKLAYDVTLDIIDDPEGECIFMLIVRKDLYSQRDAERLLKSYVHLVTEFAENSSKALNEAQLFEVTEVDRALTLSRGPIRDRMWPETAVHRIDQVIDTRREEPAVRWDDDKMITYSEMGDRVHAIAEALVAANVSIGSRVAVLQEPTGDWISSILAILRLGAVYVPLDQSNPWGRLAAMTKDCQPGLVLVDDDTEQHIDKLLAPGLKAINVSTLWKLNARKQVPIAATAAEAATILYTSGSSGTPKGILLKHDGFRNWLESTADVYDLESEVVLQQSSSGFDMSLIQVFTALCLGGSMYLVPRRLRGDAVAISELIHAQGITYTFTCTSELSSWLRYGNLELLSRSPWRRAITGGEPGVDALLVQFASLGKSSLRIFHAYGPTETSWTATTTELFYSSAPGEVTPGQNITVGRVLPNYSVYILDERLHVAPPGVRGEIYIGGPGVAAGYLNHEDLTADRFVPDILATPEQWRRGWTTLHRTGDLGRLGDDGSLFIEGRISGDTQIKMRGLRIDLREVERALVQASGGTIREAVVSLHRPSPDTPQLLVAHVVPDQSRSPEEVAHDLATIKSRLGLPPYMCPSAIIPLGQLPMTSSLKLDRRAIAALPLPDIADWHATELTDTESRLKNIWTDVVSIKIAQRHAIDSTTDFFHVGGTSLLLLELRRRVQVEFGVGLPLVDMFNMSTLASMAQMIEAGHARQLGAGTHINWDHETDLPPSLRQPSVRPSIRSGSKATVVLTGATGYLGRGLLDALVADMNVKHIHCIAVRNVRNRSDMLGLKKVTLHEGDLALPRLGLSDRQVTEIFDTADVVIHNGADVSYMKTYESLRLPNVQATKELAEMSSRRGIPLHYISSGGACTFAAAMDNHSIGPASVARFPPPADGRLGYASSKWASEVFLEKLKARHPEWPIWVHRPSNIARLDTPQLDLVFNIQHYSRLLRAVPTTRGKACGTLDSVPLNTVVQGVLSTASTTRPSQSSKTVQFLHHLGGVELPMDDLRAWIVDSAGRSGAANGDHPCPEIKEIPFRDWTARAAGQGMHPVVVAFLKELGTGGEMKFPHLVNDGAVF